jgi:hypothetical protein
MKKVVLSLLAFGLIGAGAFAQATPAAPTVTINDWGRQMVWVGNQDSSGYVLAQNASWGGAPRIVGLNIQAKTDTVGFSITPDADTGSFGLTDQNKAWVNPLPGLQFEAGINLENDTWRGTNDFGSDDWLRFAGFQQNSYTFARLGEGGLAADVNYNKDGIGAWALLQLSATGVPNVGNSLQAGAAYTFAGIGQIKAQYIGFNVTSGVQSINAESSAGTNYTLSSSTGSISNTGTPTYGVGKSSSAGDQYSKYEIAFNLSAVKNLTEEVGVLLVSDASAAGYAYQISDFADYKLDKVTLHGVIIATSFNGDNSSNGSSNSSGFGVGGQVGVDYDFGNSVGLNTGLVYQNKLATNGGGNGTGKAITGVLVGLTKGFSNGLIGIGFQYSNSVIGDVASTGYNNPSDAHWAIPLRLEESF